MNRHVSTGVQLDKLLLVMLAAQTRIPIQILAALPPIMFPPNAPKEAAGDGPSAWDTATYIGDLDGVPGS